MQTRWGNGRKWFSERRDVVDWNDREWGLLYLNCYVVSLSFSYIEKASWMRKKTKEYFLWKRSNDGVGLRWGRFRGERRQEMERRIETSGGSKVVGLVVCGCVYERERERECSLAVAVAQVQMCRQRYSVVRYGIVSVMCSGGPALRFLLLALHRPPRPFLF